MQINVQDLKHRLSSNPEQIALIPIAEGISAEVTLEEFQKQIEPIVLEIIDKTREMVRQVENLQKEHPQEDYQISSFLVVGGSTNIPLIQQKIEELHTKEHLIPKPLKLGKATWRAVALGAVVNLNDWGKTKPKETPLPKPVPQPTPAPQTVPGNPLVIRESDGTGGFDDLL